MLQGYEEDLAGLDLPDEIKTQLLEKANARAEGLANKNQELLGKVSNKETLSAAERAKLTELESFKSNSEIQAAKDAEDWQKTSNLQHEAWDKEKNVFNETIETYKGEVNTYKGQLETLLIDNGLNAQLDAVDVDPKVKAGAVALLRPLATIVNGQAVIGEKSLNDAIKEWSESDTGKAFCLAPHNSGSNANGGANQTQQTNANQKADDAKKNGDGIGHLNAHFKQAFTAQG
mgnify:CR=1 FL=1|tara:strand:+ start:1424 stop:2119 length:696 start_codon:yes stop_codon:yes gene_type:complete